MSSIKFTDNYGFSMDATNGGENANFFKRLLADAEFVFDTANVNAVAMLPLGANPGPDLPFTLTAKGSAGFGASGVASLKIDGTCKATLSKSAADDCSKAVKPFACDLPEGTDTKAVGYLSFGTSAEVDTSVSGSLNEFTFGMTEAKTVTLSNSRYFPQFSSTSLIDATRELLKNFTIPGDLRDLQFLPVQSICSVAGKGSLKFKASVGYQFLANPLTSYDIPVAGALAVNATGNASVAFAVTIGSGFTISILKNSAHTVRLAVNRSRNTDFDTGTQISAQVAATVQGRDLLSLLLGAISPDPDKEIKQLNAKLEDDERDAINYALKSCIQTNFELGLQGEIESALEKDTLVLYELDLNALSDPGKAAVESALRGDFTALADAAERDGVTELQSIVTATNTNTRKLSVHLLNVFQAGSVSALISKETVKTTPAGDLFITDEATARSADILSWPAQTDGLRKVLLTSAIITSAYKGTKVNLAAPEIKCELVHFDYEKNAGTHELQQNVNALQMLQVLSDEQAAAALALASKLKPSPATVNISLKLSADDCTRLFLEGNSARQPASFESAAKAAMYRLSANDRSQAQFVQLLTSPPAKWNDIKTAATPEDLATKISITDPDLAQLYFTPIYHIMQWTGHMSALANCVQAIRNAGTGRDPNSSGFQKLHAALRDEAKKVSSLSQDYFNSPWAILAVSQVLGFMPKVDVTYVSQPLKLPVPAPAALPATASVA